MKTTLLNNFIKKTNPIYLIPGIYLILNVVITLVSFVFQISSMGVFVGATADFLTDPIILFLSVIIGISAPKSNKLYWLLIFFGSPIILTIIMHFVFKTPYLIFDISRLNALLIVSSISFLIKYKYFK